MSEVDRVLVGKLLRVLGSAASYNDKGHVWAGHNESQQQAFLAELQQEVAGLAVKLGESKLGADLCSALVSGIAVQDASGDYVALARARLSAEHGL